MTKFHLWFPNIFEFKGGIQVYSAFLLEALQHLYPQSSYDVFLKHDTRYPSDVTFPDNIRFHCSGKWNLRFRTYLFAFNLFYWGLIQQPDLIITTHLNFIPVAHGLKQLAGIPYWIVAHGVEAWNIQRPELKRALRHADRILAVSNYTRDRLLQEQNLDSDRISLLPNTFDGNRFKIIPKSPNLLQRHGLTPQHKIILTVARLDSSERYKGYDKILYALAQIRNCVPNVHYLLVGSGCDRDRVQRLVNQLHLQNCVTLVGFVPDEMLVDYYNLCDVFAMPSKGEGFGIVYLEALACGKPVLGGDRDGAIDALCHGELGALVNPDDVGQIARALTQILQRAYPNPLFERGELLREKVIDTYGFEKFKATLDNLIQNRFCQQTYVKLSPARKTGSG
ncbi:MAG: glycosyltransferase [Cyanobacteriota bacterium]|nr:glycosyltransferase [Cyanobacteriota bacterium]